MKIQNNITIRLLALTLGMLGTLSLIVPARYASSRTTPQGLAGLRQTTLNSIDGWKSNGPQESIQALAIDPGDPNVVYAGSFHGLFKSTDGGGTWNSTVLSNYTGAVAIDFLNSDIVYAGTTSTSGVSFPGGAFLFKSTDAGITWSNSTSPIDFDFSLLVMDPSSPGTLYTGSGVESANGSFVLYRSTDAGATWKQPVLTANLGLASFGWAIDSVNPHTIYAPGDLFSSPFESLTGLFKSTDGGDNWKSTGLMEAYVRAVVVDPLTPNALYAGTSDFAHSTNFKGLIKSTDGGDTWLEINVGLSSQNVPPSITALAIDPNTPSVLYAGTSSRGVFKSSDGGASWDAFNSGLTDSSINALVIDSAGMRLYAATHSGVFMYQYPDCTESISPGAQSFDFSGGIGSIDIAAGGECGWRVANSSKWISLTSNSSGTGNGAVAFSVAANPGTSPRGGVIGIGSRNFLVTQTGAPVTILSASVAGKKLIVAGEHFDPGAVIVLNGKEQPTGNDDKNPQTTLIGKKSGKRIKPGDTLLVRNPNGTHSQEFTFM